MRVAHVLAGYPFSTGPMDRSVRDLAQDLRNLGADVDVYPQAREDTSAVGAKYGVVDRRFGTGMRAASRNLLRIRPQMALDVGAYDVVHVHGVEALGAVMASPTAARCLVFTPHHNRDPALVRRLLSRALATNTYESVLRTHAVVCASATEAALISQTFPLPPGRVHVVGDGIDVDAIQEAEPYPIEASVVLGVGALARSQRLDRAVAALASLHRRFELVLIGKGRARRSLEALGSELGVGGRVTFRGQVSDQERYRWLRTARVLVSLSGHRTVDPVMLEAVGVGTPVLASDTAAHREVAGNAPAGAVHLISPLSSSLSVGDGIVKAAASGVRVGGYLRLASRKARAQRILSVYRGLLDVVERTLGRGLVEDDLRRNGART